MSSDPASDIVKPPVILLAFASEEIARHQDLPRLPEEHKRLRAIFEPAVRAGRCELLERPAVTLDEILSAFQDDRYRGRIAVFHFAGHAGSDLLLMENRPGQTLEAGAAGLATFLSAQSGLRLVFLNGCSTLEQASGLHDAGIGAVIAASEDVDDDDALHFAVHVYRGLAGGASIGESYIQAQGALQTATYAQAVTPDLRLWMLSAHDEEARNWRLPALPPIRGRIGPVPMQKPRRVEHFIGREQALATLLANLQPGKTVTLCGPGGIGKSALVAEAIWSLCPDNGPPERFPDGIIFHTFYHQPQVDLALEAIARAYDVDPRPSPLDAARQALSSRRALLVLDGTDAADDLDGVLSITDACCVLITTRRHDDAQGDYVDIAPLPRAESLDLLRAWADRYASEDMAANELVRLLGGLPLALFLAGRYLTQRKQQASEYVMWLKEEGLEALHFGERPSKSVPLLMQRSLDQVSEQAQGAFGVAGILALAPFATSIVVAALNISSGAVSHALGELVDYGLLLRPDDSYLVTHALAHSYARTEVAPSAEIISRLCTYYGALAQAESAKGPPGYAALDCQRSHLVAVQAAALRAQQWEAVQQITSTVEVYLDLRGYTTERVIVTQAGLDAARASGARHQEAALLTSLGLANVAMGELRRAIELYEQAKVVAREICDRRGEGATLGHLGRAYAALGEIRRAIELYSQSLEIAREIGDRSLEAKALGNLGKTYTKIGDPRRAIELHCQRLVITRNIRDPRGVGTSLGNLGNAYADLGETQRAIKLYKRDMVNAVRIADRRGEGIALGNLGRAAAEIGDARAAISWCQQFLDIMHEIGDRAHQGEALSYLGYAYHVAGDDTSALAFYRRGIDLLENIGKPHELCLALANLAETYLALADISAAIQAAQRAIQLAVDHGYRGKEALARWNLGLACEKDGDLPRAVASMQDRITYEQAIGHPDAARHAQQLADLKARSGL